VFVPSGGLVQLIKPPFGTTSDKISYVNYAIATESRLDSSKRPLLAPPFLPEWRLGRRRHRVPGRARTATNAAFCRC